MSRVALSVTSLMRRFSCVNGGSMHATATIDDAVLLAGLRAGDEQAYETLVRTYGGRLLAIARRFVRNDEDAQDIVQAAYLNAFRSIHQFAGQCQIGTWL